MIIPFENIVYVDRYRVKVNYSRKNVGAKGNSNNETINREDRSERGIRRESGIKHQKLGNFHRSMHATRGLGKRE